MKIFYILSIMSLSLSAFADGPSVNGLRIPIPNVSIPGGTSIDPAVQARLKTEATEVINKYTYRPSSELRAQGAGTTKKGTESSLKEFQRFSTYLKESYGGRVSPGCSVRPCMIRGDFDGDGREDSAIQVQERTAMKTGIAVFFGSGRKALIAAGEMGMSREIGDDLIWMDSWESASRGFNPGMRGSGLLLRGIDTNQNYLVYWNGSQFTAVKK